MSRASRRRRYRQRHRTGLAQTLPQWHCGICRVDVAGWSCPFEATHARTIASWWESWPLIGTG